ncbi:MAG TPA: phosphate acyltransferase PlsX, partial [Steroidobacteraceae bacterium]|nr:phosphate acyltransferase PlsX [Steroidobacteraceae bacterium]
GLEILLVGRRPELEPLLRNAPGLDRCRIVEASEVVGMDERPQDALRRKKDSSMRVAVNAVKRGEAAACVSAGNTGALLATARFVLGMIPGIDRPAIVSAIPAAHGHTLMLDLGANPDCTPEHLLQFALMGSVLASDLHGVDRPRVGLLNIGEEAIKGTAELREAHQRLAAAPVNYVGFVEGDDIFSGDVDVVVTDGFSGNVALKTMEGVARLITSIMREEFTRDPLRKFGALMASPALNALKARLDPRAYNGASMVGLGGVVIKSHGGADEVAFENSVRVALLEVQKGVPAQIASLLERARSDSAGAAPLAGE